MFKNGDVSKKLKPVRCYYNIKATFPVAVKEKWDEKISKFRKNCYDNDAAFSRHYI